MTSQMLPSEQRFVIGSAEAAGGSARSGFNLHMLSPILIGLTLPVLVIGLIDPAALRHVRGFVLMMLVAGFVMATVLFALSLLWQGEVAAVVFNKATQKIEFVQTGMLANTGVEIHFDQVASIGIASRFDPDGYPFSQAEIQLRDGQHIALPAGTTPQKIADALRILGR
jgi:hypothetical protein